MTEPDASQPSYPAYPGPDSTPTAGSPTPPGHGQPGNPPAQPGTAQPGGRPGTVLTAGIITIILSAMTLLTAFGVFAATNDFVTRIQDYIRDHPSDFDIKASDLPTDSDIKSVITGLAVVLLIVGIVGLLLGIFTMMGKNWARIMLIIAASLTAVAAIPASLGLVGLPWLAGSITVIVLLLSARAKAWFAAPKAI